jgi:quinol monooxygenase YgiN
MLLLTGAYSSAASLKLKFEGCTVQRCILVCCRALVIAAIFGTSITGADKNMTQPLVRIAELEIDPSQISAYTDALKEEIAASIRDESGVIKLYAVSVKNQPAQIRIFEVYKDQAAYESHLQTPHFKKYKSETQGMVRFLKLIEAEPILLGGK